MAIGLGGLVESTLRNPQRSSLTATRVTATGARPSPDSGPGEFRVASISANVPSPALAVRPAAPSRHTLAPLTADLLASVTRPAKAVGLPPPAKGLRARLRTWS